MSAVPKITERPLIRPAFVVTESLATFIEINRVTLHDWYAPRRRRRFMRWWLRLMRRPILF